MEQPAILCFFFHPTKKYTLRSSQQMSKQSPFHHITLVPVPGWPIFKAALGSAAPTVEIGVGEFSQSDKSLNTGVA